MLVKVPVMENRNQSKNVIFLQIFYMFPTNELYSMIIPRIPKTYQTGSW